MNKNIGIYKFQNLITQEVYIGQSINLHERYLTHKRSWCTGTTKMYESMQQYGWDNFTYEIIEYCPKEKLNEREMFWVQYYDSYKHGFNHNKGGSNKNSIDREKVHFLWDNGFSIPEIIEELNISQTSAYVILNAYPPYMKYQEEKVITSSKVFQYNLDGTFEKEWNSQTEASQMLNIDSNSIRKVITGERKSAGGFIWTKTYMECVKPVLSNQTSIPKRVEQYTKDGELIGCYDSIAAAARAVGGDSSLIRRASQSFETHNAYGFKWKILL